MPDYVYRYNVLRCEIVEKGGRIRKREASWVGAVGVVGSREKADTKARENREIQTCIE